MKIDLFQSCGHCWVFQICLHIECNTSTASSFKILKNSAGILSPPLALFVAMLPKAHLTLYSRMPGSRLVTTLLWLSRSLRPFLYISSVYSCHLYLISSASVRPLLFLSFIVPILAWNVPLISPIFLLFLCIICWRRPSCLSLLFSGTLHPVRYTFPFLPCFSLFFFPQLFVKPPQTTTCIYFSLGWFWSLLPVQFDKSLYIVFQALCLPDLISWIYLLPPYVYS